MLRMKIIADLRFNAEIPCRCRLGREWQARVGRPDAYDSVDSDY